MSLQRHTPLVRRTPLRKESRPKASWNRRYRLSLAAAKAQQVADTGNTFCVRCGVAGPVEGHHTETRIGRAILTFRLLCNFCHTWVHEHANLAREEGLLPRRGA